MRAFAFVLLCLALMGAGTRAPVDTLRGTRTFSYSNDKADSTFVSFMVRRAWPDTSVGWIDSTDWTGSSWGDGCDTMDVWLVPFHGGTTLQARMEGDSLNVLDRAAVVYDSAYTVDVRSLKAAAEPRSMWRGFAFHFRAPQCGVRDSVTVDTLVFGVDTTIFRKAVELKLKLLFDADLFIVE